MSERRDVAELGIAVAREVGTLQRERFHDPREIHTKSSAIDLVTDVDRACDRLAVERIRAARPRDAILTEETGEHKGSSGWRWIIDPLDGTTNYAHGFPHYAISIGVEHEGVPEAGAIYDPMKDELFHAELGGGAFLNRQPIRVSGTSELQRALLATGFGYHVHDEKDDDNLELFRRFIKRSQAVRRAGAAALDLAYVACGRFDGFWELHLHPWDVAAGLLLIDEAGGCSSDINGGPVPASADRIVASNTLLHPALLAVLRD